MRCRGRASTSAGAARLSPAHPADDCARAGGTVSAALLCAGGPNHRAPVVDAATNKVVRTTHPGRPLVTGRGRDISAVKLPPLRALATRPPYFHNGSAASLDDVVRFYGERFAIGFTPDERADLLAFLRSL